MTSLKHKRIYILIVKPFLDWMFALLILITFSWLILIIAIIIKSEDGGKILFKQKRPGKNEKIFTLFKFRTMSDNPEMVNKTEYDMSRMTKVGKFLRRFSLDELPQLINIIKGEMSFIGPRPLLIEYLEQYDEKQKRRHSVKPGVSGWAQVNGRNVISWAKKFEYDNFYVENIGLRLDIIIFLMTIKNIIKGKDINQEDSKTVDKFNGKN